jgi:hypothetical protein
MVPFFLSLLLTIRVTIGMSPLKTTVNIRTDEDFLAGTVCLIWESDGEAATPGSNCWTVSEVDRHGWTKELTLRTGHYEVWVTTVGQDTKGNALKRMSRRLVVEVY